MNLQSEDTTKTDYLRRSSSSYLRDGECDVTLDKSCFKRVNEQSADRHQSYCDGFNTRNLFIIPQKRYINTLSEPRHFSTRGSSESICSRIQHTDSNYPPKGPDNSEIETKPLSECISKLEHDTNTKVIFTESSDQVSEKVTKRADEKACLDKITYCRPVINVYNQQLLYETMMKNDKLRRIVTDLAIARQKEKEKENWNNYINSLRRKHNGDKEVKVGSSIQFISDEYKALDSFEEIYNNKFTCKQSGPCHGLFQNIYNVQDIKVSDYNHSRITHEYTETPKSCNPYKTNRLCFPISSQGRFIMLERERMKRLTNRGYKPSFNTINEEKKPKLEYFKTVNRRGLVRSPKTSYVICNSRSTNKILQCNSTQTDVQIKHSKSVNVVKSKECNTVHVVYEKECAKNMRNKKIGPETFNNADDNLKNSSLICIEKKLDNLMHSINNFLIEMKTNNDQYKNFGQMKLDKRNINYTRSDVCNMTRTEKIVCGLIDDSSPTTRNSSFDNFATIKTIDENLTKINDIFSKGIGKNKLITLKRSSAGETYPCSVQISVTIPTREISTEVTRSLSEAANVGDNNIIIEEIPKSKDRQIATAVNTDPLSLLAILRVSTEQTIRRVLAYVPTIDYYSYLFKLQGQSHEVIESQYVCNICGAAFTKPSALTDHIQKHELGNTRDCCVCRHVLDLPRRRPGLFKCQYCGQRFTRAYCCELHQEACARRLGKLHDVPSSLMLLR